MDFEIMEKELAAGVASCQVCGPLAYYPAGAEVGLPSFKPYCNGHGLIAKALRNAYAAGLERAIALVPALREPVAVVEALATATIKAEAERTRRG